MLRHYDEIGLLKPSFVDVSSGYRYYLAEQLPRLNRIIALKDLGFSLDEIAFLLNPATAPEAQTRLVEQRRAELERSIARDHARLRQLDALQSGASAATSPSPYDVVLRSVPACRMATIRQQVTSLGDPVTALFENIEAHVGRQKARAPASPLMILHDEDFREADLDVEVAVPVTRSIPESGPIRVRDVEGCPTMACVIYRGGYDQMTGVLQALLTWTACHRMRIAGPVREVYLRFGADQEGYRLPGAFLAHDAGELVTEVQLPVEGNHET
jgi:DNA-binding transcriptional MerR regulator